MILRAGYIITLMMAALQEVTILKVYILIPHTEESCFQQKFSHLLGASVETLILKPGSDVEVHQCSPSTTFVPPQICHIADGTAYTA